MKDEFRKRLKYGIVTIISIILGVFAIYVNRVHADENYTICNLKTICNIQVLLVQINMLSLMQTS